MQPTQAKIIEIIISPGHSYWVSKGIATLQHSAMSVNSVECVAGRGIRGDRYMEKQVNHKGQVTLMTLEAVEEIRQQFDLPELSSLVFRRNLIVAGIDLSNLVGQRFEIQGVVFEGTQECTPCRWMDRAAVEGVREFMKHNFRGGLRAKIRSDGFLTCDHVRLEEC